MRTRNKFWWFVAMALSLTAVTFVILGVFFWNDLTASERATLVSIFVGHPTFFFTAFILLIAAVGFALDGALNSYILPLKRMVEGTRIILSANPAHRLTIDGGKIPKDLADLINLLAARIETGNEDIASRVAAAREKSDREKNILSAMIAELPNGIVVSNLNHRIILYNRRAKRLLEGNDPDGATGDDPAGVSNGRYLGLGRNMTSLVDGELIRFAMEDIIGKVSRDDAGTTTHFVIPGVNDRLIHAEMVPVLDSQREFTGYILILSDVTERMESRQRMASILGRLITRARASLAGIRSAIESMVAFADMDDLRRAQLRTIIHDESITLSGILDASAAQLPSVTRSAWPLMPVRIIDLMRSLRRRCRDGSISCQVATTDNGDELWINADHYLLLNALAAIVHRAAAAGSADCIDVRGNVVGGFVHIDLNWQGASITGERLQQWLKGPVQTETTHLAMSIVEIVQRHDGEIIMLKPTGNTSEYNGLRLLLPALASPRHPQRQGPAVLIDSRPEFYDFDLFSQAGQLPEMDSQPLDVLTFTVFDTETTGLNPRGGDEIISIGGVRIVNLRLLMDERFDQLVNPQRQIPWESIKYHGIRQEMVADKPTVDQTLARFHRFVADTVLVGHNVAFDMRMLQLKEVQTGIYFINPVLDTMLLSAVVHPTHDDHSMEGIAYRLGVRVEERHTAMGDAVTTARIFLKLVPLLKAQGIRTLGDARRTSQKTYFARLEY
jgi:DNA polymerase-3 subunit epsilon